MEKLIQGVRQFQSTVLPQQRELFRSLARGQSPSTLFITCSDSRIVPELLTQSSPGELFTLRNAGNIIPPPGGGSGAEEAAIEYAMSVLKVGHVVLCGHTHCGAMAGLAARHTLRELPAVDRWLQHSERAQRLLAREPEIDLQARPHALIQMNVLVQLEHLQLHPAVARRLHEGALELHGWFYDLETGEVQVYHREMDAWMGVSLDLSAPQLRATHNPQGTDSRPISSPEA